MKWRNSKKLPYIVLTAIAVVFLLPLLWVIIASIDPDASQALKVPMNMTLGNYRSVLEDRSNVRAFGVGLIISLGQSILVVMIAGLAAYPLSRYELKHKKLFMFTMLFMTSLPITAVMVPVYRLFLNVGLYDNIFGVVLFLTASAMPYGIWLMKNFIDGVPVELEEAAWMDGANVLTSMQKVIAPLMFPGICVVFIYTFSGSWGNFFVPYILIQSIEKFPASIKLYQFFGQYGMVAYGELAAYSVLYALPSLILYVLSQKYMSKGFNMSGASKG